MTEIFLHGRKLESVFQLLGGSENSITYSIGWAMANSPNLVRRIAAEIGHPEAEFDRITLQEHGADKGFTDIEMLGASHHVIIEAKRGWWLPQDGQWIKYLARFRQECGGKHCVFLGMSDCTKLYANLQLAREYDGIPVKYLGWRDIENLCRGSEGSHAEKRLLKELQIYLRTVATMQNPTSNMVFVVSLGSGAGEGATISWIDIVEKCGKYFHPVGNSWPKEPPLYIAFRYRGQLRSIHRIESYLVTQNLEAEVPGTWAEVGQPHFVYTLVRPFGRRKRSRTGQKLLWRIGSGRCSICYLPAKPSPKRLRRQR